MTLDLVQTTHASPHYREQPLQRLSGAFAMREVHRGARTLDAHRHDWPTVSVPLLGAFVAHAEDESVRVRTPIVLLHPARSDHGCSISDTGLDAINICFDPAWVRTAGYSANFDREMCWGGEAAAKAAALLARLWTAPSATEQGLAKTLGALIESAVHDKPSAPPRWLSRVEDCIETTPHATAASLARLVNLHPAWLARAYRKARGEGLRQTLLRRRAEKAAMLLRQTNQALADIAAAAGFADQSHMTRRLRCWLGRTPLQVRQDFQSN